MRSASAIRSPTAVRSPSAMRSPRVSGVVLRSQSVVNVRPQSPVGGLGKRALVYSPGPPSFVPAVIEMPQASAKRAQVDALNRGVSVHIGGQCFCVKDRLGSGSFGTVWSAEGQCGEVAIKDIVCRSKEEVETAFREAEFLGRFATGASASRHGVPQLVATDKRQMGPSEWNVRLVMTRLPGEALDKVLERAEARKASGGEACRSLADISGLAQEMLLQLASVMDSVASSDVVHRDAHARNILLHEDGPRPVFGLVDFGLAIGAARWRSGSWKTEAVGGDCRYWPVSAWVMLLIGECELRKSSVLIAEYSGALDRHSLGLTALQLLVSPMAQELASPAGDDFSAAWCELRLAWKCYWAHVTCMWRRVYEAFQRGAAAGFVELRKGLRQESAHEIVRQNLSSIRTALTRVREASACSLAPLAPAGLPNLVDVLLLMISDGTASSQHATSWQDIRSLLETGEDERFVAKTQEVRLAEPLKVTSLAERPQRSATEATSSADGDVASVVNDVQARLESFGISWQALSAKWAVEVSKPRGTSHAAHAKELATALAELEADCAVQRRRLESRFKDVNLCPALATSTAGLGLRRMSSVSTSSPLSSTKTPASPSSSPEGSHRETVLSVQRSCSK